MTDNLFITEIITPEKKLFFGKVSCVLVDDKKQGQTAVLARHAPLFLSFGNAKISVTQEDKTEVSFDAGAGVLSAGQNKATVLMETAD